MTRRNLFVAAALAALAGCQSFEYTQLSTWPLANSMPATVEGAPAFAATSTPDDLPMAAPYVRLDARSNSESSLARQAHEFRSELLRREESPDFILVWNDGLQGAGTVFTPVFGVVPTMVATHRTEQSGHAVGYRITRAALGVVIDAEGWILRASEAARAAGLLEGDRITHVAGVAVRGADVPHRWVSTLLDRSPGDHVHVQWIRSGTGVLEADVELEPNRRMPGNVRALATAPR